MLKGAFGHNHFEKAAFCWHACFVYLHCKESGKRGLVKGFV
jgi:hypothetical protein